MTVETAKDTGDRPEGRRRSGKTPERRCLVTGEVHSRDALLRFAVGPDDIVVPDLDNRLPGRGLWLTGRRDIVATACEKRAFSRGAGRNVTPMTGPAGEDLATFVEQKLVERTANALGLARKSGDLVAGFEKVRGALNGLMAPDAASGQAILLCASDAGTDGREKIGRLAGHAEDIVRLDLFDAATLGRMVGRERAVHALVRPGGAARQLRVAAERLAAYRGGADALPGSDVME